MALSLEDDDLNITLGKILDVILDLKWLALAKKGCVFLSFDHGKKLKMVADRNLSASLLGMCSQISYGQCLCGQAALSQKMVFKSCIDHDHHNMPEGIQPHGHYNVPVLHDGKTLAVINLYVAHGHQQQDDEIEFLNGSANAVASIIRRKHAELELKKLNESLGKQVQERTEEVQSLARFPKENPFPVLRVNKDNLLIYANDASSALIKLTEFEVGELLPDHCVEPCEIARTSGEVTEFQLNAGKEWYSMACSPSPGTSGELNIYGRTITDRIRAEYDLSRLVTVVEQAAEIVVVTDIEGVIQYVNPAFEKVSGYSSGEVIGKTPNIVKSDKHDASYYVHMWQVLKGGETWKGHFINQAKDGTLYEVTQTISPIFDKSDEITGYSAVQHDVTAERKAEQKVQHADRLESLGVLAGGIAHDFNNLLTVILGNAAIGIRKTEATSPSLKYLKSIEDASHSAADLCKQMLAYSGKGKFVVKPVCLSELVESMGKLLDVSRAKNVVLKYHLHEHLLPIDADIAQMQQVILNLITNASEAIEGKSGVVSISTGVMQADADYLGGCLGDEHLEIGRYVYVEVSDTGCGMDAEMQTKIFDPFFTTKFTGRGLGMSAMRGIVKGHHGGLRIYSEVGKGTTIKVILPISHEYVESLHEQNNTKQNWRGAGTVLIIDDEESIREIASVMLEDCGFHVLTACDGLDGVEVFRQNQKRISLVLLDMTMPKMNGVSCFTELCNIQSDIQVILSSGYSEEDISSRFSGKGLAGFIQKPYSPEKLEAILKEILDDKTSDI